MTFEEEFIGKGEGKMKFKVVLVSDTVVSKIMVSTKEMMGHLSGAGTTAM
ncbi:MAG: hypothetical protein LC687_08000 [Actinobacteria bacterium]|nr:hypothetical protein [Actinomycetota bacterium]